MKKITFSDQFTQVSQEQFKISRAVAQDVITNHDHIEQIKFDNLKICIFQKCVILPQKQFDMLVFATENDDSLVVNTAFKLLSELNLELQLSPLKLAQVFAERFGMDFRIGSKAAKFVLSEKIKSSADASTELVKIINPKDHSFAQEMYVRKTTEGFDCALAFCIDTDIYKQWIKI